MSGNEVKDPFAAPVKKDRKPRKKIKKERLHIYLTEEAIKMIDDKAEQIGCSRSITIQIMLNFSIKNFNKIPNAINAGK